MRCSRVARRSVVVFHLTDKTIYEPSLIGNWQIVSFSVREASVIHQVKDWLKYDCFFTFRRQAKKS